MKAWRYGTVIREEDGDFVVSVRDLPEVVTSGATLDEALELAADAIVVAVEGRMDDDMELPEPTRIRRGERVIRLPAQLAAKASVYSAWKAARVSKTELARRLDRNEVEVRRILNPRHGTKLDQLDEAARALGGRLNVSFEPG
jgi:antitoxin HicB